MAANRKKVVGNPVRATKGLESQYRVQLMKLGRQLVQAVKEQVLEPLKAEENSYVADGIATNLAAVFARLNKEFTGVATFSFARQTASGFVERADKQSKKKFDESVKSATGVDFGSVIAAEGLEEIKNLSISNNVSLIKSLPTEYLKTVETIVSQGVASGARYSTIQKQIMAKLGSANSKLAGRIKTIATDQTQTITAQLTLRRSRALGIKKGIYRTSEDEKVRTCHRELNGVEYELSKGAWSKTCKKFIQPGITDINCRCGYSPVIEVD